MAKSSVWIECKLPHGLDIYLEESGKTDDGKPIKIPVGGSIDLTRVRLNGANSSGVIGGHGLTEVAADFWESWFAAHKNDAVVRSGAVKMQANRERAVAQALDERDLKTGFEGIDPKHPEMILSPADRKHGLERVLEADIKSGKAAAEMAAGV
jgi:hypothetical protein